MGLKLTTPSTRSILATSDVKKHLNIDISDDDSMLDGLALAADRYIENYTQRQLLTGTYTMTMDAFPAWEIQVPRPPLQSVTGITYIVDSDGSTATLSTTAYRVTSNGLLGRITPAYNDTWPTPRAVTDSVTITFTAGATDVANVPHEAKQAAKMLTAHFYVNRTAVVAGTITAVQELAVQSLLGNLAVGDYA